MDGMPDVSSLPEWVRTVIFIGGFIGGGVAVFVGYFRKGKVQPTDDLVITGASIADTKPVKDLVDAVRAGVSAIEDIRDLMREAADEAEIERRAEEMAEIKFQRLVKRLPRRG